jgi:hypothetical protein
MSHLEEMMIEATQYRMLLGIFRNDPQITQQSARLMRDVFLSSPEGRRSVDVSPLKPKGKQTIREGTKSPTPRAPCGRGPTDRTPAGCGDRRGVTQLRYLRDK